MVAFKIIQIIPSINCAIDILTGVIHSKVKMFKKSISLTKQS